MVIYKRKYLKGNTTVAAVINVSCCQLEDRDSSGTICENAERDINKVEGSTAEFKLTAKKASLGQLLADMEKLAGDVIMKAILQGTVIDEAKIYGVLVDVASNSGELYMLHIKFNEISVLTECAEGKVEINDCLSRLYAQLSK